MRKPLRISSSDWTTDPPSKSALTPRLRLISPDTVAASRSASGLGKAADLLTTSPSSDTTTANRTPVTCCTRPVSRKSRLLKVAGARCG